MGDVDDDLHVCLKCHDQIVGLDNYIEHRRSSCRGKPKEKEGDHSQSAESETAAQVAPNTETRDNQDEGTESSSGPSQQVSSSPELQDSGSGKSHPQKRKRGRPQKIVQTTLSERPTRLTRQQVGRVTVVRNNDSSGGKRNNKQRKTRQRQVPIRYADDDWETGEDGEDQDNPDEQSVGDDDDNNEASGNDNEDEAGVEEGVEENVEGKLPQKSKRGRKPGKTMLAMTAEEETFLAKSQGKNGYSCKPCAFVTNNFSSMLKHVRTIKHLEHLGKSVTDRTAGFTCDSCPMTFFSEQGLEVHKRRHEQKCKKCDITFPTRKEFIDHNREEHNHTGAPRKGTHIQEECPTCGKMLSRGYLKIHMRIHTGEKPYGCDACPFRTNQLGDLKMHKKRHLGIKDHKCSLCSFVTVKASILKSHMKLHTKRERTESCHLCERKFYNKMLLKSHIHLTHEDSRIHKCTFPDCTYKFKFRIELVSHMRKHTKEKPFLCTICGYTGSTNQALMRHTRKHTGVKPFKCDHPGCSYMGRVSTHLTRHKRLHTGEKPYKCPYCSYRANTHENVRKHIRGTKKHAGLPVYTCKFCSDLQTDVYEELVDHIRKVHADDYLTYDRISHQSGLLADKEEPPVEVLAEPSDDETADGDAGTDSGKHSQDLQLAIETVQSVPLHAPAEHNSQHMEMAIPQDGATGDASGAAQEYILCSVIQEANEQQCHDGNPGNVEASEATTRQEIQMVTVEEEQATEAIQMILQQAVGGGHRSSEDFIIL